LTHSSFKFRLSERHVLEPKVKIWVEKDGALALSGYRIRLLKHIAETGSLAEGARRMGLSYRRAWGKIREIENNLGVRLVDSEVGGPGGGSTHLTPTGERIVGLYEQFEASAEADVQRRFAQLFREQP
jgi:molybdate transport system regulatory protein